VVTRRTCSISATAPEGALSTYVTVTYRHVLQTISALLSDRFVSGVPAGLRGLMVQWSVYSSRQLERGVARNRSFPRWLISPDPGYNITAIPFSNVPPRLRRGNFTV
jgi:hypothetical protein